MLVSKKQLKEMVPYSDAHIDRLENPDSPYFDPSFPKRIKKGFRVFWVFAEVEDYVRALIARRDSSK